MRGIPLVAGSVWLALVVVFSACAPAAAPPPPTPRPAAQPAAAPTAIPSPTAAAPQPAATPTPRPAAAVPTAPAVAPKPQEEKPVSGGVLNIVNQIDIAHFDMHTEVTALALQALAPTYSQLLQADPKDELKIVPDLAERWDISPDGKTYTFYLRKGVKFHDGTPLTAADVKASYQRIIWPPKGFSSPREVFFRNVERLETPDDYTVRFTLKNPQASFLLMVTNAFNQIYSKRLLEQKGDMKKDVMGSGPFKFVGYDRSVSFTLERNKDYFLPGLPYLDGIQRYVIKDYGAQNSAFRTGKLDLMVSFQQGTTPKERELLKKEVPGMQVQMKLSPTARTIHVNLTKKPWTDPRLRQAIDLAIDRQAIIDVVQFGEGVPGGAAYPGAWSMPQAELLKRPGYRQPKDQDMAEARKIIEEAGYKGLKFPILARTEYSYSKIAVLLVDQLKKIGLEAEVKTPEDAAYWIQLRGKDSEMAVVGMAVPGDDPDYWMGYGYLTGASSNWSYYSNPKLDDLYGQQSRITDPVQRKKVIGEMEKLLLEDRPMFFAFWRIYSTLVGPRVRNYLFTNIYSGQKLEDVWLAR